MMEKIEFLSDLLLVSKDPSRRAHFYREIVGIPLEDEKLAYPLKDTGFSLMTAMTDLDENYVEFTNLQIVGRLLADRWFKHLQKRREKGAEAIERWKALKKRI